MTSPDHFAVVDDAISPQPWMQLRQVAEVSTAAVSKSYDVSDGAAKNDPIQKLNAQWKNNTPLNQYVYGMVTRGGSVVSLQTRSRAYLLQKHGIAVGDDSFDVTTIVMAEASRLGTGANVGLGGLLAIGAAFSIAEIRATSSTMYLMPQLTGWFVVEPGQTFYAAVALTFVSDFWENTTIDGGDAGSTSSINAGELRLDLFAAPTIAPAPARTLPTIVGGADGISHDQAIDLGIGDTQTHLDVPTGTVEGDVLVAITANDGGLAGSLQPVEDGWLLAHSRNDDLLSAFDVHLKVWTRVATADEPDTYSFHNSILAEEITVLFALHSTVPYDGNDGGNWAIASNLSRFKVFEDHVAPSITKAGQLLICASFLRHDPTQAGLTQTAPTAMTDLLDLPGTTCCLNLAMLNNPPNPTNDRQFVPSANPLFDGHAIAVSILVPGAQVF